MLRKGGVDVEKFSVYSTRHATTSAASRGGLNIDLIRQARIVRVQKCLHNTIIDHYLRIRVLLNSYLALSIVQCLESDADL
nr:unnamed protein product [Callosobruchus chinensis]